MKKIILIFLPLFVFYNNAFAQKNESKFSDLGIEVQQYPTGFLFGIRSEFGLAEHHTIDVRIGYNILNHEDLGEHEDEKGGGFGVTLGYRYYFKPHNQKWFLGARTDLWFNKIDWIENREDENRKGETKVTVLQPTAIVGYRFLIKNKVVITPTLAFGAEINIKTKGETVGQGAIILWGLNVGYQL